MKRTLCITGPKKQCLESGWFRSVLDEAKCVVSLWSFVVVFAKIAEFTLACLDEHFGSAPASRPQFFSAKTIPNAAISNVSRAI